MNLMVLISLQSSRTSHTKGVKGRTSSNLLWKCLISWSAVSLVLLAFFLQGSFCFTTHFAVPLNSFLGHLTATVRALSLYKGGGVPDVKMVSDRTSLTVWQGSSAGASLLGLLVTVAATSLLGELGTGKSSIMPSSKGLLGGLFRIGRGLGLRGDTTSIWGWSNRARVSPIDG